MIKTANAQTILDAVDILKNGGLVAIPTETVYGLAARADEPEAVQKIFDAKGRPAINPLIIHVASIEQAERYAVMDETTKALARQYWPGPLTLVLPLKKDSGIAPQVTAGLDTIAVRCPAHKTAQAVLKKLSVPLAAPSANKSGTLSPTRAIHVSQSLGNTVDMILADKGVNVGVESTILDLTTDQPVILRTGALTARDFEPLIGDVTYSHETSDAPKAPGQMFRHYAPSLPLRLNAVDVHPNEALLAFGSTKFMGIKGGGRVDDLPEGAMKNLSESGDLEEAAANLFAMLHDIDQKSGKTRIAVMNIPDKGIGRAINDRLRRAAES